MSERTNCPNCGAPIDYGRCKCAYCGTPIKWIPFIAPIELTILRPEIQKAAATMKVTNDQIRAIHRYGDDEAFEKFIIDRLADQFLPHIKQTMTVKSHYEFETDSTIFRGDMYLVREMIKERR